MYMQKTHMLTDKNVQFAFSAMLFDVLSPRFSEVAGSAAVAILCPWSGPWPTLALKCLLGRLRPSARTMMEFRLPPVLHAD